MVGFAFAMQHPDQVSRFVLIDAPVPGVGPWEEILKNPLALAFPVRRPGHGASRRGSRAHISRQVLERVLGRSDRVSTRRRASTMPLSTRCLARCIQGFAQFAAFDQDALDNQAFLAANGKLQMPVLAHRRRKVVRAADGGRDAVCGGQCHGRRYPGLRTLDHGREPGRDGDRGDRIPEIGGAGRQTNRAAEPTHANLVRNCPPAHGIRAMTEAELQLKFRPGAVDASPLLRPS